MRPITHLTLSLLTLATLLVACRTDPNGPRPTVAATEPEPTATRYEFARYQMGGDTNIILYAPDQNLATLAAFEAMDEIDRLETIMSDYKQDSEAMQLMAREPNVWHNASPDLIEILVLSSEVWSASRGAFDPTIGPVTALWRPSFNANQLPKIEELESARSCVGMNLIELDTDHNRIRFSRPGMRLDFGGIGKGYAAQKALSVLRDLGYPSALVDLGGDIALGDPPPGREGWTITIDSGLDEPRDVILSNTSIATSGDKYRFAEIDGVRYSHIIDPRTGMGLTRRVAVTVIDPLPWRADALASAVSVLGETDSRQMLAAYPDVQVFIREAE